MVQGMVVAVKCLAPAIATSTRRAAMGRSQAVGSQERHVDSRHILAPSTALGLVAAAETFYLCVLECVVPRPSSRPFTHTHMQKCHLLSLGTVLFHAHK